MVNFSTFGNELYTGKRSYDFVGCRKLWFLIAGIAVALSILIPVAKGGFNLGIEFRGGSEFTVSNVKTTEASRGEKAVTGRRGGVRAARGQRRRHHHADPDGQAHRRRDAADQGRPHQGLRRDGRTRSPPPSSARPGVRTSPSRPCMGLAIFVVLAAVLMALYFRTWKMSLLGIVGLAVTMFITAGVYAPQRLRGHAVGRHRLPDDPQLLAVRHRGGVRQDPREHRGACRRPPGAPSPKRSTSPSTRPWCARSTPWWWPSCRSRRSSSSVRCCWAPDTLRDISLALFVGIIVGTYSTIFIAAPLYAALRQGEPELVKQAKRVEQRRADAAAKAASPASPATA